MVYELIKFKKLLKTLVIGYCRLLNRGGEPEFFGITYIDYELSTTTFPISA